MNPNKEVTLQLRNLNLTVIEEFPSSYHFDCLDLSNNSLVEVAFTLKLSTLILNNNTELYHINMDGLQSLHSLSVINGNIKYTDVESWKLPHLHNLVLIGNPILAMQNYRLIIIKQFPNLRVLDFAKVKKSERQAAKALTTLDQGISPDMRRKLLEELENAQDLDDIERIERLLAE